MKDSNDRDISEARKDLSYACEIGEHYSCDYIRDEDAELAYDFCVCICECHE